MFISVSRRTFPSNQRKHKQTCFVVVVGSSHRFGWNGIRANAPSEKILRNEKIGVSPSNSGGRASIYLKSNAVLFDGLNWIFFLYNQCSTSPDFHIEDVSEFNL